MKKSDMRKMYLSIMRELLSMDAETYERARAFLLSYPGHSEAAGEFIKAVFDFADRKRPLLLVDKKG